MDATLSSPSLPSRSVISSSTSKAKGMQLGANKVPTSISASNMAPDWAQEAAAEADNIQTNPWGNDDLIDVNADQDDWSAFESAPAPAVGLGFASVSSQNGGLASHATADDPWGSPTSSRAKSPPDEWDTGSKSPSLPIHQPKSRLASTARSPPPTNRLSTVSTLARSPTPSDSGRASPATQDRTPTPSQTSTAGMSKEEKAAEMARRKEERKQRIAALKEQKKNAGAPKS